MDSPEKSSENSWRLLWGEEEPSTGEPMRGYFPALLADARKAAWDCVVANRVATVIWAIVIAALSGFSQFQFGMQSREEMVKGFWSALFGLGMTGLCALLAFLYFLFYLVPKRRLVAAVSRIRKAEEDRDKFKRARDDLLSKKNETVLVATKPLRDLFGRGDGWATAFEMPDWDKPTFNECVTWNENVSDCVKQLVSAGIIQHEDLVRFEEHWNEADCQNAERRLDAFRRLDEINDVGRVTYRYIFGRVKRVQELLEKIDGKGPHRARLLVSYYPKSLDCMMEYRYADGQVGTMVRLRVEPGAVSNEPGGVGVLKSVERDWKFIFAGGNLPLSFASADLPDARNKLLKHGEPAYLELVWIPNDGEAEIKAPMPYAPSYQLCNPLDRNSHYALTVSVSADRVPATVVVLYAFFGDDAWHFHTKRLL